MSNPGLNLFDLQEGKVVLGRYRIEKALAHGPLSARFSVLDTETDRPLRMEAFLSGQFEGHGQAAFFADHLQTYSQVKTDFSVPCVDIVTTDGGDVLRISQPAEGECLRDIVSEGRLLSRSEAVRAGLAMLQGLVELHSQGLAHGDIKPSNLYLSEGKVQATEGGVTPALWRAQHMGARTTLIGTPFYAPLEQFSGEMPSPSSDLHAVGTVLYEALCGALPWAGKGFIEVFQSKMEDNPPPIESRKPNLRVGKALEEVLRRSLRARRDDHFANAVEFLSALQAAAAESVA